MSIKWTQQEDNLLKQLDALGYSSSKIYKEYGSILKEPKSKRYSSSSKLSTQTTRRKTEGRHGQLRQCGHARKSDQPDGGPHLQQTRQ